MLDGLDARFAAAKKSYDSGTNPLALVGQVCAYAIALIENSASMRSLGSVGGKKYEAYEIGKNISRPVNPALFIPSVATFNSEWDSLVNNLDGKTNKCLLAADRSNKIVYAAAMSFAVCIDLYRPASRKTPGTFFEVLLGSLLSKLTPKLNRTKFISLPGQTESVSTDIVLNSADGKKGLVIPAKITTRERIVQPFAHQRILDSVFGADHYNSVLTCVSETQRDGPKGVKEICVPGTIRLFQNHLAGMAGIYYLDPPARYLAKDVTSVIKVATVGELLHTDLSTLIWNRANSVL